MGKFLVGATLVAALGFGRRDCRCAGNEEEEDASSSILRGGNSRRRIVDYSEEVYNRQPLVTVVEGMPSQLGIASMSDPNGTLWCGGAPTYWITGHQPNDSPYCQIDGEWLRPRTAILPGLPNSRDRHYCVPFDVNHDGRTDIICTQGALQGLGVGLTEIYLTNPNGSLKWIPNGHGLQTYPTMRTRVATVLKNTYGNDRFVFVGTEGKPRPDGKTNVHRMFRNTNDGDYPYFTDVSGPWEKLFIASCAVSGDFTGDKGDDLVVCNKDGPPLVIEQRNNGQFVQINLPNNNYFVRWRNVRIADVTRDGIPDLVVVTWGQPSHLYVFRGITTRPFFNFATPWYETGLKWAAPDVEVLDVDQNGYPDIYVVQTDETPGQLYCGVVGRTVKMGKKKVPPLDKANDLLLVGTSSGKKFSKTTLSHSQPGCGAIAQRWNDTTMLLGQGSFSYSGFSLLLEWL